MGVATEGDAEATCKSRIFEPGATDEVPGCITRGRETFSGASECSWRADNITDVLPLSPRPITFSADFSLSFRRFGLGSRRPNQLPLLLGALADGPGGAGRGGARQGGAGRGGHRNGTPTAVSGSVATRGQWEPMSKALTFPLYYDASGLRFSL